MVTVDSGTWSDPIPVERPASGLSGFGGGSLDAGIDASDGAQRNDDDRNAIGDADGSVAIRARDFLDSLGVGVHVAQRVDSPMETADALAYAGIRNMRDDGRPETVASWISMHERVGARLCLLPNQDLAITMDMARKLKSAGALLAVEGPNEPNNFPITYKGQTSSAAKTFLPVAHFQRDLYAAVKSDAVLKDVPVFHSSEGGAEPDNVGLQFLTIPSGTKCKMPDGTAYADFANVHNYVVGLRGGLVDNSAWNSCDPLLNTDWDGLYGEYGRTWRAGYPGYTNAQLMTLPRVSTETGWLTRGAGAISEEQQGRVLLNVFLSSFSRGFSYTFIYMIRDDPIQGHWGLFDVDYRPKRSGTYVHNLTTILADHGERASGKLDYSLVYSAQTVHDLLLQKQDGTFYVVVWNERVKPGSDAVTLYVTIPRSTMRVYDPTVGTEPVQKLDNVSVLRLELADHPLLIELPGTPPPKGELSFFKSARRSSQSSHEGEAGVGRAAYAGTSPLTAPALRSLVSMSKRAIGLSGSKRRSQQHES